MAKVFPKVVGSDGQINMWVMDKGNFLRGFVSSVSALGGLFCLYNGTINDRLGYILMIVPDGVAVDLWLYFGARVKLRLWLQRDFEGSFQS